MEEEPPPVGEPPAVARAVVLDDRLLVLGILKHSKWETRQQGKVETGLSGAGYKEN